MKVVILFMFSLLAEIVGKREQSVDPRAERDFPRAKLVFHAGAVLTTLSTMNMLADSYSHFLFVGINF